jgi:steroid delta-isomerase-like uncharacterized protein
MSEENKALVRLYADEVFNKRNYEVLDQIMAFNFLDHVAIHGKVGGREGFKQFLCLLHAAFPDGQVRVEDLIAEGDKVVWRWTLRGTHRGEFRGIAPTGKLVTWTGIIIWRMAEGQIVEWWANNDTLGLLQQLGVIPALGQG